MQATMQLSTGVDLTPDQRALIEADASNLERFFDRLLGCRVTVGTPHHRPGGEPIAWSVRLALTVPGHVLTVTRAAKPSFREALEDAFEDARRQLQDYAEEVRDNGKAGVEEPRGRISRILAQKGCGFITAEDGHELYFQRSSVPDGGFDRLAVGAEVRLVEIEGEFGPQASMVMVIETSPAADPWEGGGGP